MKVYSNFWTKQVLILFLLLTAGLATAAQDWMPGYNFRKKITIDKSKVSGTANLLNFPVLIAVQDPALKYISSCEGKLKNSNGLDISFTAAGDPLLPIEFQLDHYDAVNGKLVCWVNIHELFAGSNPGTNEIYLYYGSNETHDSFSLSAQATWSVNYQQVWHMDFDAAPCISRSANRGPDRSMKGIPGMGPVNFSSARIGNGLLFNGSTDAMYAPTDTSTTVLITAWVKFHQIGIEQVILASDTTAGGYVIKINADGNLVFESKNVEGFRSVATFDALSANTWYNIAFVFTKGVKRIYVNGVYKVGNGSSGIKMGSAAALSIGRSKQNDRYFKGQMDELRIQNVERNADWLSTEYRNQDNPTGFISAAAEEVNPANVLVVHEFTGGTGTEDWASEGNWSLGTLPGQNSNVTIKAGKQLRLSAGTVLNRLILEPGATFYIGANLEVNCSANIATTAAVVLEDGVRLTFKYDVLNNGSIVLNGNKGSLVFKGNHVVQTYSGTGTAKVSHLEIDLPSLSHTVLLQSKIDISQQVELIKGTINSNGNLNLLATASDHTAALMPVMDAANAQITGNVNVQHFVEGNFFAPSTARGWWLLASPVYQSESSEQPQHDLSAIKASVFVTGMGGIQNGFDVSPQNGGTIYTHDQSLPGSLSQKYKAISNMNVSIPMGKGFYLFSRGSRNAPDAYLHQIQSPPFFNPGPYVITYTGKLYTGGLTIALLNRNTGAEGDGFNLLGNPYASAVRWAALQKNNVSPFIWVFNTQNNAYQVTDDPDYIIPSGTAFFVRVNSGHTSGSLRFHEAAKYTGASGPAAQMSVSMRRGIVVKEARGIVKEESATRLKIQLDKDGLTDDYMLIFRNAGNNGIDDADAAKIGEGYLSIAGIAVNGAKLAIDERDADTVLKEIFLYVKGWVNGRYTLKLKTLLKPNEEIVLTDHYLDVNKRLTVSESNYDFFIDLAIPASYGPKRFSIGYRQLAGAKQTTPETDKDMTVYPNPFTEVLYLKSASLTYKNLKILIRDLMGRVVWQNDLAVLAAGIPVQQLCGLLEAGIYSLQLVDRQSNKVQATFKVWKN